MQNLTKAFSCSSFLADIAINAEVAVGEILEMDGVLYVVTGGESGSGFHKAAKARLYFEECLRRTKAIERGFVKAA